MTITGSNTTSFGFQKLGSNDDAGYSTINEVVDGIDTILNASDRLIKASQTPTVAYVITGDGTDWVRGLVVTNSITDLAVTTGKINDLAVTTGKIAADAVTLGTKTSGDYVATITGTANQIASSAATTGEGTTHTLSLVSGAILPGAPTVATAVGSYPQASTTSRVSTVQYVNDAVADVNSSGSVALSGDISGTAGATTISAGVIVNADVNASAAIAYSKLNLASSITSADIVDNTIVLGDLATALQAFLVPTGTLAPYAGSTAPTGWLLCDGSAVSQTTYAALYAVVGGAYDATSAGAGNFRVPDLRGRTIAGLDNMGGTDAGRLSWQNTLGTVGTSSILTDTGTQTHTLTSAEMPSHTHTQNAHSHSGTVNVSDTGPDGAVAKMGRSDGSNQSTQTISSTTATNQNTGGGGAHNNMQPTILLNYIIKV